MFLYTNTGDLLDVHNKVGLYLTGTLYLYSLFLKTLNLGF